MPTISMVVTGKVQGVFYRATAQKMAIQLGLNGWVKNTRDGCVALMVSGDEEALHSFIEWCRKGPPEAAVTNVKVEPAQEENFSSFRILR